MVKKFLTIMFASVMAMLAFTACSNDDEPQEPSGEKMLENIDKIIVDHYFPEIHFTAVLGQREEVKVKPDPIIVSDILEVAKVTKEEVLYVGDSGVDMQTAANAGVTVCGVTWGFRPRAELEEFSPQYIVDTAEEIKRLIL